MKIKDAAISILAGYLVTTLPIWEVRKGIWIVGAMAAAACYALLTGVRIDIPAIYRPVKAWIKRNKNTILKITTIAAAVLWIISMFCMSLSGAVRIIGTILYIICGIWLATFYLANLERIYHV